MDAAPLLELLTEQADAERSAVVEEAKAQAQLIHDAARKRTANRRERNLAELEGELLQLADRSRQRAHAEAEMIVKTTRDTITDELLQDVSAELLRIPGEPGFQDTLLAMLAELMDDAQPGMTVLVPTAHQAACEQWLKDNGHSELNVEAMPKLLDGVAVQDAKQSYRVTNTLSTRFHKQEASLRKHCLSALFGGVQ